MASEQSAEQLEQEYVDYDLHRNWQLQELRNKRFDVLDQGFIELQDVMGSDLSIVEAARLTSQKTGRSIAEDRNLIRYLMRHRHSTPIEMVELKFKVRCPMDVWRQWIRHRMATVNEYSTRYSKAIDARLETDPASWRLQAKNNRQGSSGLLAEWPEGWTQDENGTVRHFDKDGNELSSVWQRDCEKMSPGEFLSLSEKELHAKAVKVYEDRLAMGIASEQARKDLPLSTYTEAIWKIDLHNLLHFLGLRMDSHAQYEIRQYANIIGHEILKPLFPIVWEAFSDYRLDAVVLTALDTAVIRKLTETYHRKGPWTPDEFMVCQVPMWVGLTQCRERDECLAKLRKLGLVG